ncbi:MAG TPA: hypothetical protein PLE19_02585 [Planctomycetota bacterium]|nr:hypothetical protein [Planctomycetota bacterium]HRR80547.1 hypothetical protein [Planctomycetota bacterium]HRT93296.1 hypothetical protein [Planctomycetota bacterium]
MAEQGGLFDAMHRQRPEAVRPPREPGAFDRATWLALGLGGALAGVCLAVPWLRFALSYLTILIHELGHAVVGWLFGYPSIPAFDFTYGGGITTAQARSRLLLGFAYVLWAALVAANWRDRRRLAASLAGLGLFIACAHTAAHQAIILFMGHGAELAIAGVFLYRAMSGSTVVHEAEHTLYALCGFFIVFSDIAFAYRLWTSPAERAAYGAAKGGGHWMDFSQLARQLGLGLPTVAFLFLLGCLLPVALSVLAHRGYGRRG